MLIQRLLYQPNGASANGMANRMQETSFQGTTINDVCTLGWPQNRNNSEADIGRGGGGPNADIIYKCSLTELERREVSGRRRFPGDRPRLDAHLRPGERLPALHAAVLRRTAAAAPEERARNQARDDLKYSRIR